MDIMSLIPFAVFLFLPLKPDVLTTTALVIKMGMKLAACHWNAGDVLEDDPVGKLKVFIYEMPRKYNHYLLEKDNRCLYHMFAAEIFMHQFLLASAVRTMNPEEADWFYTPVYVTCDLTQQGFPLPFRAPRIMRSAIQYIAATWPYWNRTEGADHFFLAPHDFGACFHYQEERAIERGILPLLRRATLVQTFGQRNHVCMQEGSITIPPYANPQKMQAHLISPGTPRSIFAYFRGLFYDMGNDPEGGYYARGARASVWENFKDNPLFDMSSEHPSTYYEDMQRAIFCLCPLGWAPWSPRLVEAVVFGCIPVIIADDIVLPFADAIPWEQISVFVAEADVPRLDSILASVAPEDVLRKQRLLASPAMKQAVLFHQPARPGDAFDQVLNGLARKLPHREGAFLKPGEKVLDWNAGLDSDLKPW
ncbi:probable glucuronosyltransferase Os01g0926400 isoform X2 [Triticum aestivum]|uniref:probable glucuronosyltransferase Os01g0926400 isoform X2 n=1 Tax=Triticum aestivum TaxID=4565 RepID=UPI001D03053B|nr:probable glucuronosyltransferase Os01g0926400 isoform X2 [Triticum aestivum]